jgi:hypothetical protein
VRYPKFRKQGLFVGSGMIEAGCRTLIVTRLKRSGMFWTVCGANAVIALRFVDSGMSIPEILARSVLAGKKSAGLQRGERQVSPLQVGGASDEFRQWQCHGNINRTALVRISRPYIQCLCHHHHFPVC